MRRLLPAALGAALLAAVPALAATVIGTGGADVLRGSPRADNLYGKAGNDRLLGLGGADLLDGGRGRDVLEGGAGRDRLLARDGARDTIRCGPGRDTVVADQTDRIAADCEVVRRPAPSPKPGETRDNPIPLGRPGALGNGWVVRVTAVHPDATAEILAADPDNEAPAPGKQFFMVAVSATYTGEGSSRLEPDLTFLAVGEANVAYTTYDDSCGELPEPSLPASDQEVFTGGTIAGNAACWQIPSSDAASLVMYSDPLLAAGERVFFALR